jgi:hypothetical protein
MKDIRNKEIRRNFEFWELDFVWGKYGYGYGYGYENGRSRIK